MDRRDVELQCHGRQFKGGMCLMKSKAFTLIELLTVIAIITVLASILFPVFATAREKGRQTACASNSHQLGAAIYMYVMDNGDRYPAAGYSLKGANPGFEWGWVLAGSMRGTCIVADVQHGAIFSLVKNTEVYRCPSDYSKYETTYKMNWLMNRKVMSAIDFSSTTILLSEAYPRVGNDKKPSPALTDGSFVPYNNDNYTQGSFTDRLFDRHVGNTNITFTDGHSQSIHPEQLLPMAGVNAGGPYPTYYIWFSPSRSMEKL